jgi:hypothetical protein
MPLPPGILHESFCAGLARYHASISVRVTEEADKEFHGRRADAFADCVALPPFQMRLVMILSDRFFLFDSIRGKMVASLHKCPLASKPAGVLIK